MESRRVVFNRTPTGGVCQNKWGGGPKQPMVGGGGRRARQKRGGTERKEKGRGLRGSKEKVPKHPCGEREGPPPGKSNEKAKLLEPQSEQETPFGNETPLGQTTSPKTAKKKGCRGQQKPGAVCFWGLGTTVEGTGFCPGAPGLGPGAPWGFSPSATLCAGHQTNSNHVSPSPAKLRGMLDGVGGG